MKIEMNGKQFAVVFFAVALAFSMFGYAAKTVYVHRDPKVNVWMTVVKGEGANAQSLANFQVGNLITDIGENYTRDACLTVDGNTTQWAISLSNDGSSSAAWTELPTEVAANGFTRAANETYCWMNSGDAAFNVTIKFTATGTQQLQTAGLQWDDTSQSDNNLFAAADFTQTTFDTDDTLTVTWIITFNAN